MKLRYTPAALAELERLADISKQSPHGARRVLKRIGAVAALLAQNPHSGQLTSLRAMRRIVVTPYPYVIFYEPGDDEIIVVGVRHGARHPSSMPDQP